MKHKYIDDLIGENHDNLFIFTEDTFKTTDERNPRFKEEQEIYGFSSVETWGLDYTMDCLLYERLKMYMDVASKVIDLSFYKFDIPVLYPSNQKDSIYDTKNHWYITKIENHTQEECINLMIDYLKDGIISMTLPYDDADKNEKYEQQGYEKACTAWDIFAILRRGGVLWW